MEADIELKNEQARWEPWKVMAAALTAVGVVVAGVFGALGYMLGLLHH